MLNSRRHDSLFDGLRGRPLLSLTLSVMAGITLYWQLYARGIRPDLLLWAAAAVLSALFCCLLTRFHRWQPLLLPALLLGMWLCSAQLAALDSLTFPVGAEVQVCGTLRQLRHNDSGQELLLHVEQINGSPARCGNVLVYLYASDDGGGDSTAEKLYAGSRISVCGRCTQTRVAGNRGSFDYNAYLRLQGISAQISTSPYDSNAVVVISESPSASLRRLGQLLRSRFEQALELSGSDTGLLRGVFLGESSGIEEQEYHRLRLSGLLHVFALSGLHVGYVAALGRLLGGTGFQRRWRRLGCTALLLLIYLLISGVSASLLRAILLLLLGQLAVCLMQDSDPISELSLAALLCLLYRPLWLFSAGFQLSFAAVWGLKVLRPALIGLLPKNSRSPLLLSFATSLAASLATLPLLAYYFNTVSWLGWLLSPPAVLLAGGAVLICFISVVPALISPLFGSLLLRPAALLMRLMAFFADRLSALPWTAATLPTVSPWAVALFYLFLLCLPLLLQRQRRCILLLPPLIALFIFSPLLTGGGGMTVPDETAGDICAEIVFLDVGQGDCTLILTADGKSVLIDGGGSLWSPGSVGRYTLLPYLRQRGITRLDLIVSSHPDIDHIDGLFSVFSELSVDSLLYAACFDRSDTVNELHSELLSLAAEQNCRLYPAASGDAYQLGEYLTLHIYSPSAADSGSDENSCSLLLEISIGEVDLLFTGDATAEVLDELAESGDIEAEIIKLPHHGSKGSYSEAFYAACAAQEAVISVGAENSYGHPHACVVEYWQEHGRLFRTDLQGAITVYTDGRSWQTETEK